MKTSVIQMLGGLAAAAARAFTGAGDIDPTITATGVSSQANSYGLKATMNIVTAGGANTGVRLGTDLQVGDEISVFNESGASVLVYPDGTNQINNAGASTAVAVANNVRAIIKKYAPTKYSLTV